jgi:hypothetical protein
LTIVFAEEENVPLNVLQAQSALAPFSERAADWLRGVHADAAQPAER